MSTMLLLMMTNNDDDDDDDADADADDDDDDDRTPLSAPERGAVQLPSAAGLLMSRLRTPRPFLAMWRARARRRGSRHSGPYLCELLKELKVEKSRSWTRNKENSC